MTTSPQSSWLPNLVGGVSIWKLAVDLNEPRFFDGRLLIPETEGSDRLPASVTWNVQGMIPLADAKAQYPEQAAAAIRDFGACVERVQTELADPASGYKKYKDAFSVPALDAAAENYFFDPGTRKLFVTNWGASPRSIAGSDKVVFGYDAFGAFVDHAKQESAAASSIAAPLAAVGIATAIATGAEEAPAAAPAPEAGAADAKKDEKKKDEKKDDNARPWWMWLLLVLVLGALIALILFLLRSCEQHRLDLADAGADANASSDGAASTDGAANGQMQDGGSIGDAAADASPSDASADAGDAGSRDAGNDGGRDGGKDGGVGPHGETYIYGPGGKIIVLGADGKVIPGAKGPNGESSDDGELAHRVHVEPKAAKWRVVSGKDALDPSSPTEGDGTSFDIALKPGHSGEGVKVQWQDGDGKWHNF